MDRIRYFIFGVFVIFLFDTGKPLVENQCSVEQVFLHCNFVKGKFLKTYQKIDYIYITESDMTDLTKEDFLFFENVRTIEIRSCMISSQVQKGLFSVIRELSELKIEHSNMTEEVGKLFAENVILEKLSLRGNRIAIIGERLLGHLPYLEELDLSFNRAKFLEDSVLDALPSLKILNLRGNSLGAQFDPSIVALAPNRCAVCHPAIVEEGKDHAHCSPAVARSCKDGMVIDSMWWRSPRLSVYLAGNPVCNATLTLQGNTTHVPPDEFEDSTVYQCESHVKGNCFKHEIRRLFLMDVCEQHNNDPNGRDLKVAETSFTTLYIAASLITGIGLGIATTVIVWRCRRKSETTHEPFENVRLMAVQSDSDLHTAALTGNYEKVKQLLDFLPVDTRNKDGDTPLHYASRGAQWQVISLLLARSADINAQNNQMVTPLSTAINEGNKRTAKYLMDKQANVELPTNYGSRPIHLAAYRGYVDTVKQLLEKNAEIDTVNLRQMTSLFIAAQEGHDDIVDLLLKYNANCNIGNKRKELPIHIASWNGHYKTVEILLNSQQTSHVEETDGKSWRPIHHACKKGHLKVVELLLQRKADCDAKNNSGNTPLHKAVQEGHVETIELLLQNRADSRARNKKNETPLDIAIATKNFECQTLIKKFSQM